MTFWTIPDFAYRATRYRRLLGLQAGIQLTGLLIGVALGAPEQSQGLGLTAGILLLITSWLTLRLPHGYLETLSLSVTLAALWASAPGWLSTGVTPQVVLGTGLTGFFAWLALTWLVGTFLPGIGRRTRRLSASFTFSHPPEAIKKALTDYSPNQSDPNRRIGPADDNGLIPVQVVMSEGEFSDIKPGDFPSPTDDTYFVKILEDSADQTILLTTLKVAEGVIGTSTSTHRFIPEGTGTRYETEEIHDSHDLLTAATFWLQDYHVDTLQEIEDDLSGLPSRALRSLPFDTPLTALAKCLNTQPDPGQS